MDDMKTTIDKQIDPENFLHLMRTIVELMGGTSHVLKARQAAITSKEVLNLEVHGKLLGGHLTITLDFDGNKL